MSATVSVSIRWDGTAISVTNVHDLESEGSPSDSTTNAYDVIGMLRDCAMRAEDAAAAGLVSQKEREKLAPVSAARQKHDLLRSTKEAIICRCGAAFSTNEQFQEHLGKGQQ